MQSRYCKIWVVFFVCLTSLPLLVSCKSKSGIGESKSGKGDKTNKENVLSSEKIIKGHYRNKNEFSTLYIRSNAKYSDEKQTQNISAEIKIKKNEIILVSVRFLGITMAKALITPKEVKYYEKMNGTYFEGNYQVLSQWLGTDLDFNKIQNMLIGRPIDDLTIGDYTSAVSDTLYTLNKSENNIEKSFYFESEHYLLKKQKIVQADKERSFEVNYPNFKDFTSGVMPLSLMINASQKKGKTAISIDYNSITFNEELSFPYSVPGGYERIYIN